MLALICLFGYKLIACLNHHKHPSWVLFGFLVVSSSNWSWYNYVCLIRWVVLCDVVAQLCV